MDAVVPHLVELGLTRQEARVYAALVVKGESEAGVIKAVSEVPHSAVYGTLKRLESRGLVERSAGSPARFRAVPPTEVLRRTRDEMHCAADAALKGLRHLRQSVQYARSRTLWIAEGRGALAEHLPARLARARKEILVIGHPLALRRFQVDLDSAASRGVRVIVLGTGGRGAGQGRGRGGPASPGLTSLGMAGEFVAGAVDRHAFFYGWRAGRGEELAWSESPSLVQFALFLLNQLPASRALPAASKR